ncbi:MAG TPA: HD domain-containing protein, partial [Aquihabitans sp.]|nr:HD domain-containing protein [Aquihabitans sp.]
HDVGKPKTRSFGDNGVTFHHHEVVGARMARDRMQALKYSNEDVEAVRTLVYLHLRFHGYGDDRWSDAAVRRFVRDAGDQYERLVDLTASDCTTRNRRKAEQLARRMVDFQARVAELRQQEALDAIRPDLDGRQVMEHLGLGPGPHVGRALAHLLELRLEEGPLGHDEAIRRLDDWWADQGPEA